MNGTYRIQDNKASILINTSASFVLAVVFLKSIEVVFCEENRAIRTLPVIYTSLHFILLINLIVDWISGIAKSSREKGLSILAIIGFILLLVTEGYICILAFDSANTISLLIFIGLVASAVLYDFYMFIRESRIIYAVCTIGRSLVLIMFSLSYISLCFAKDVKGMLSLMLVYIVAKVLRLHFIPKREVLL